MNKQEIIERLSSIKGAKMVTIVSQTEPPMRKTNNPYAGKVVKVSHVNGVINWNYERSVNRQREREGSEPDFEALPRSWGDRIMGTPLVRHVKDGVEKRYLEMKVERVLTTTYIDYTTGEAIDPEVLRPFLRENAGNIRQNLEKPVILRDYNIDNIAKIFMDGEEIVNEEIS